MESIVCLKGGVCKTSEKKINLSDFKDRGFVSRGDRGLVQWFSLPAWKDHTFVPRSGIQVAKKEMFLLRSLVTF